MLHAELRISRVRHVTPCTRRSAVGRKRAVWRNAAQCSRRARRELALSTHEVVATASFRLDLRARRHEEHSLQDARELVHREDVVRVRRCRTQTHAHVAEELDEAGYDGLKIDPKNKQIYEYIIFNT